MDLGQAELKIIAHLIQEETMLRIFELGQDIHAYFGAVLLKLSYEEFLQLKEADASQYNKYRSIAKVLNFSLLYAMSIPSLQQRLLQYGIQASFKEAESFYNFWHSTFPGVKDYHKKRKFLYDNKETGDVFQTYAKENPLKNSMISMESLKNVHQKPKSTTKKILSNFPIQATYVEMYSFFKRYTFNICHIKQNGYKFFICQ